MPLTFEARHLDYLYANGPLVVRDVSLTALPSSMTAVIGANGSGKSTLIRMLAGLLRPLAGTISMDGIPLSEWVPRLRAREIAYVPQATATAFPFRVLDVVLSGRTPHAARFHFESVEDSEKAVEALDAAGAAHLAERCFTSLSGGERQMVILARALAQEPRFLLLDEPSSSLDLKHRADLIRTLVRLRATRNLSVVMITHDVQLTGAFDRLLALRGGVAIASGTPDEVLRDDQLREIYGDPNVRSHRMGDQTLVWVDL
jgi:iron complex transport system ATP-binding protein